MRAHGVRLGALTALAVSTCWPASAQDPAGDLATTIMSGLAALPDRQAAFTDTRTLSALVAPVQSNGVLVFRHPDHLEKRTAAPRPENLVIEGGTLTIAEAGKPARTIALGDHPALLALATTLNATLAGDLPRLRRSFVVTATGSPQAWRMVLTPADPRLRRFLASVTLEGAAANLHELRIVQANGDAETMQVQP